MDDSAARSRRRAGGALRTGCPVEATLSVIGGVWKPVLLYHLLPGKLRFNALCRLTPNATPRMVTLQLRELEADGVIRRIVYPEVPPKVEYELTPFGRTLEPVLATMRAWGATYRQHWGTAPADTGTGCVRGS
jgi:DNA-binding HxlR family transcriptional regulator